LEINGRTALKAWEQAVSLLRAEMSPASYQAYLAPARALRWQAPGILLIGAADEPARAWLESRVRRTVERMLVGILNQPVTVEFEWVKEAG
jgi:chromosomal replication initiation ATPase DnaA